jgi:hypothetical protein
MFIVVCFVGIRNAALEEEVLTLRENVRRLRIDLASKDAQLAAIKGSAVLCHDFYYFITTFHSKWPLKRLKIKKKTIKYERKGIR